MIDSIIIELTSVWLLSIVFIPASEPGLEIYTLLFIIEFVYLVRIPYRSDPNINGITFIDDIRVVVAISSILLTFICMIT